MGSTAPPFTIKDEPVENLRPLKVRVIGAGYSGIYLGIRIPQRLRNIDLQIYEKNEGIGGTWYENRYPGCACDIPSHSYQYSFNPNPSWSSLYAPAPEICAYLEKTAEKYGANRFIKLSHKVLSGRWDDRQKKWRGDAFCQMEPGVSSHLHFDVPFRSLHLSSYNFKNKRVGVIGGGSSAIQIVPNLQKIEGIHLSAFVRTAMIEMGFDPAIPESPLTPLPVTPEQIKKFETDPEALFKFRKTIEVAGNMVHGVTLLNSDMQTGAIKAFRELMSSRLASKPDIAKALIPSFAVGCRRLTPGPGYLEALVSSNVDFISDPITHISPTSIHISSSTPSTPSSIPLDALILATGFLTSHIPPIPFYGLSSLPLSTHFSPHPQTYLSLATSSFPNYFIMLGPNSSIGSGSLTAILEAEGDYIIKCIRKLQREDYASMVPKHSRVEDFTQYCARYFEGTVYGTECRSWYKGNATTGRVTGLWPGSTPHALETLRSPRWEDWEWESWEANALGWLGNGWSATQLGDGDSAWYLEEEFVDVPVEGEPERDRKAGLRPWCY
ncbi:hypothetical protein CJF30_00002694 [Rutstroemia sp. NJR-2017a BBW]|nr:hypothetical protein CJF30_00002694 [Rutstroemia sp. NJR-2017a BBW]